jgi:hypothetical protein
VPFLFQAEPFFQYFLPNGFTTAVKNDVLEILEINAHTDFKKRLFPQRFIEIRFSGFFKVGGIQHFSQYAYQVALEIFFLLC